jgi:hypothetical protein
MPPRSPTEVAECIRRATTLAAGSGLCFRTRMPNLYLLMKTDGSSDEVSADSYQRDGDDWLFTLRGDVVVRIPVDDVTSIARARD